jgi:hypothetical protein
MSSLGGTWVSAKERSRCCNAVLVDVPTPPGDAVRRRLDQYEPFNFRHRGRLRGHNGHNGDIVMKEDQIAVVDVTPLGPARYRGERRYGFHTSYPNVRVLDGAYATKLEAYNYGAEWVRGYEAADPFGNMACVIGVTRVDEAVKFLAALKTFEDAGLALSRAWDGQNNGEFTGDYPFTVSLDEMMFDVQTWRETCERVSYSAVVNYFHSNT